VIPTQSPSVSKSVTPTPARGPAAAAAGGGVFPARGGRRRMVEEADLDGNGEISSTELKMVLMNTCWY
jgi:hypothetical protein